MSAPAATPAGRSAGSLSREVLRDRQRERGWAHRWNWDRISPVWLAVALSLTVFTRLRVGSLPLGPGEILLFAWIVLTLFSAPGRRQNPSVTRVARYILGFWYGLLLFITLGWCFSYLAGFPSPSRYHDFLALVFSALFSVAFAVWIRERREVVRIWKWLFLLGIISPIVGYFFSGDDLERLLTTGARFRAFSHNPNQLGLMLVPLPFLAAYFLRRVSSGRARLLLIASYPLIGLFGYMTKSEAVIVGWALGLLFLAAFSVPLLPRRAPVLPRFFMNGLVFLFLSLVLLWALEPRIRTLYALQDQGSSRLALWLNGWRATLSSPLFGLGPGAHSGVDAPFQATESHNSVLDLMTSGGMASGFLAVLLVLVVLFTLFRHHRWSLMSLVVGMVGFALFHNVLRQPLFWFYLFSAWFLLILPDEEEPVRATPRTEASEPLST